MSYRVLVVDDNRVISRLIKNILRDAEMLSKEPEQTVLLPEYDYGWYRKFEKTNKRKNFTKK